MRGPCARSLRSGGDRSASRAGAGGSSEAAGDAVRHLGLDRALRRAYLQFLACAAGSGPNAEAFAFATRLTRLTRALGLPPPGAGDPARRRARLRIGRAAPGSATR